MRPLLSTRELMSRLEQRSPPVLLDVRWRMLGPPTRQDYAEGHLPGAVFVDLDAELAEPPGPDGRHPLPDPDRLQRVLRHAGVDRDRGVVAYDADDGSAAARAWWLLRWAGHELAQVLDGGYAAWVRDGFPVTTEVPTPEEGDFEVRPGMMPVVDAAARIAGGSLLAAERILSGAADRAVSISGGLHHAMADRAGGFCIYNDCSVAIAWLLANGVDRIAYLDLDVHHGDGVQAAFYDDPRVLTVSLHQHPVTLWPGTGFATEVGAASADGKSVNVPLPPGTDDAAWQRAFHAVVPSLLDSFRPQVLVTQCGADAHRDDPLADLALSVDGQRASYRSLRELAQQYAGGKWLALGGGGYSLFRVVPRAWTHLLATVLDRDLKPASSIPADWMAHVTKLAHETAVPTMMTDEYDAEFTPWSGVTDSSSDTSIRDARHAVFPLHGLDPSDSRD